MSLPLWLDPASLNHFQPAHFSLYCGLLSVGVFDSVAAVAGSSLGRTTWTRGSSRTLEGSLAGLLATIAAVFLLWRLGGSVCPVLPTYSYQPASLWWWRLSAVKLIISLFPSSC